MSKIALSAVHTKMIVQPNGACYPFLYDDGVDVGNDKEDIVPPFDDFIQNKFIPAYYDKLDQERIEFDNADDEEREKYWEEHGYDRDEGPPEYQQEIQEALEKQWEYEREHPTHLTRAEEEEIRELMDAAERDNNNMGWLAFIS